MFINVLGADSNEVDRCVSAITYHSYHNDSNKVVSISDPSPDTWDEYHEISQLGLNPMSTYFELMAKRFKLMTEVVFPTLAVGGTVVCNGGHYLTSSVWEIVWDVDKTWLDQLNAIATNHTDPDLVILLKSDADKKLMQYFLRYANDNPERFVIIDTRELKWDMVQKLILSIIEQRRKDLDSNHD